MTKETVIPGSGEAVVIRPKDLDVRPEGPGDLWVDLVAIIGWRISEDLPTWPIPILLDSTDPEEEFVVVKDGGKWREIGAQDCDSIAHAMEYALGYYRQRWDLENKKKSQHDAAKGETK